MTHVDGQCATVFDGEICTWGTLSGDEVVEFGATIPVATADLAPLDAPFEFPPITLARIPFPDVVKAQAGVDHLAINWEAQGHPPATYFTPHFDFHVYFRPGDEIEAIDCSNPVKPASLPDGYVMPDENMPDGSVLIGICVPRMGMHALPAEEQDDEELFNATMVMGYYSQELIFVEPMVARAALLGKQDFSLDIPAVENVDESVMLPARFNAVYDAENEAYSFVFRLAADAT
ncbi:MAG: hypothetical protein HKN43_12900 [Rhodothermales bacterium]|nr:hypothetical protein [Rhodothermales bacterium]